MKIKTKLSMDTFWMMQQSESHITIGFTIVGSMCMCDAPFVAGGCYYGKNYHGYHLNHKISYNLHLSDLIGTSSL